MWQKKGWITMELQINQNYRIITDTKNVILQELKTRGTEAKNAGEQYWDSVGYYGNLENCFKGFKDHSIRNSECKGYIQIIELLRKIDEDILATTKEVDWM